MRICNFRLLDPNQEHQALIPIKNTPRGGVNRCTNQSNDNDVELKTIYTN